MTLPKQSLVQRDIGPITILFGKDNGKYPHGNSLLVTGRNKTAIIDPSLGVKARSPNLPKVDMVLHSHVHEDHVAGSHLFADVPWWAHWDDLPGLASIEGMLDIYGLEGEVRQSFEQTLRDEFFYQPHEDIHGFGDDACFDLGGVRVRAMHTPGHTRGHCCFVIDWDDSDERLVYLGDIELTGFGPYYGDAWSDLEDFERSLALIAEVDAHWWLTFHHKGLIEGRPTFLSMLAPYTGMIAQREAKLLAYLAEPHTLADIVEHRFVYRPGTGGVMADSVERRSMGMHLQRMLLAGSIRLSAEGYVVNTKA